MSILLGKFIYLILFFACFHRCVAARQKNGGLLQHKGWNNPPFLRMISCYFPLLGKMILFTKKKMTIEIPARSFRYSVRICSDFALTASGRSALPCPWQNFAAGVCHNARFVRSPCKIQFLRKPRICIHCISSSHNRIFSHTRIIAHYTGFLVLFTFLGRNFRTPPENSL